MKNILLIILYTLIYTRGCYMNLSTPTMPGADPSSVTMPGTSPQQSTPTAAMANNSAATMPGASSQIQSMPTATQAPRPAQSTPMSMMPGAQMTTPSAPTQQSLTAIDINNPEIQKYKQDLDALTASLQQLDDLKNSLKNDVRDLDSKLTTAHQQAEDSKKISFDILQQESEQQANNLLEKVKDNLKKIQELQQFIQTNFSGSFNKKITDIKVLMTNLTNMIQQLEVKVGAMPQAQTPPPQQGTMNTPPLNAASMKQAAAPAPQPKDPVREAAQSQVTRTFFGTIKDKGIEVVAWLVQQTKKLTDWILTPSKTEVKKKIKLTKEPAQQQLMAPTINTSPVTLPDVSQMKMKDRVKTYITIINNSMQTLDEKRIELSEQYHDIKMTYKTIQEKVATCTLLNNYLSLQKKQETENDIPVWRKLTEHGFSRALDFITFTAHYTKIGIIKAYNYFFARTINEFTDNVKEKLKEMESRK